MGRKKEPSPVPVLDDEEYEVRKIVGHKIDPEDTEKVRYLYRVRWVGYTPADDTWEPKESLEGGAEGILQRYVEKRKDKGYVFFKDGSRKAKVYKYLDTHGLESDVLGFDARDDDEGLSPSEDEDDDEEEEEEQAAPARDKQSSKSASAAGAAVNEKEAEKERKRKKRESEAAAAAAAAEDDAAMDEDEDERRSSKKSRRTSGSPMPIPPSVLRGRDERDKAKKEKAERERAEKENSAVAESSRPSKKPSSKRSEEDSSSGQLMKKRPSSSAAAKVTQESDDDEDARVGESLKRSPLKEKKADQRKSEEPARSSTKPVSVSAAAEEPIKVATLPAAPEVINQGPAAAAQEEEEDESTLPLGSDMNRKLSSWEDLVTVESLEQSPPSEKDSLIQEEYKWLIRWNDNVQNGTRVASEEWVGNSLARKKFPQGLLSFYEDHLKFKSTPEDGEEEPNGAVNGEDAVMD